jgi:hypothetical protein
MAEATQKQVKKVFISLTEEEAEVLKKLCHFSTTIPDYLKLHGYVIPQLALLMEDIYGALVDLRD